VHKQYAKDVQNWVFRLDHRRSSQFIHVIGWTAHRSYFDPSEYSNHESATNKRVTFKKDALLAQYDRLRSNNISRYTVNLTADGTCTSGTDEVATEDWWANPCARTSNITTGDIINPVRSARLTTSGNVAIKYGRVEVVAKMPKGDWLWPAIWFELPSCLSSSFPLLSSKYPC
jgi:hypothetical protein